MNYNVSEYFTDGNMQINTSIRRYFDFNLINTLKDI